MKDAMRTSTRISTTLAAILLLATAGAAQSPRIQVVPNEAGRRVDVIIDGQPFTSYIYPTVLKKPTLFPLRTAKGTTVTRGYPLEPRPGERVDHPHHVGLWFNHGDVNGLDFWNNSDAIPAAQAPKMGTIQHTRVVSAKGGADRGELTVEADWLKPDGTALLRERTSYVFRGDATSRTIDRVTTLTALGEEVVFKDIKEGVFGMRVARALELPDKTAQIFTDASGKPASTKVVDNTGVTGDYLTSEGVKGEAVWGTRAHWALLAGTVDGEAVTIAILDHPSNPAFPTYWHARPYGLFAANPMGEHDFTGGKKSTNLTIVPGGSGTFRYRVLILSGPPNADLVEQKYAAFAKEGS
jgi:hypothetical protein